MSGVNAAAFSADGQRLVSGDDDGTIALWDAHSGKQLAAWENELPTYHRAYPVYAVAFSPSGGAVVTGGNDYAIKVWDLARRSVVKVLKEHYYVMSLQPSVDGAHLVSGSTDCLNADASIKLWDVRSGIPIATLEGDYSGVSSVAFSPDGTLVASGSADAAARIWSVRTGRELRELRCAAVVQCVAFSPDGRLLATGDNAWQVRVWDVASGAETAAGGRHDSSVRSVCFSGDGRFLVSAGWDRTVRLWNVSSGQQAAVFEAPAPLLTATFSPNSREIRAADEVPRVYRFDVG